jgi:hypothetical protein
MSSLSIEKSFSSCFSTVRTTSGSSISAKLEGVASPLRSDVFAHPRAASRGSADYVSRRYGSLVVARRPEPSRRPVNEDENAAAGSRRPRSEWAVASCGSVDPCSCAGCAGLWGGSFGRSVFAGMASGVPTNARPAGGPSRLGAAAAGSCRLSAKTRQRPARSCLAHWMYGSLPLIATRRGCCRAGARPHGA